MIDFFEKFHDSHPELKAIAVFTREEFFKEMYMIEVLAIGLPEEFQPASEMEVQCLSARSGRSSNATMTQNQDQQTLHLELQMLSNIKSFYKERNIDISDMIDLIKEIKRSGEAKNIMDRQVQKMYW